MHSLITMCKQIKQIIIIILKLKRFVANGLGIRHLQIFLLFLGLLSAYSLRVNLSVGIVAMVDKTPNSSHAVGPRNYIILINDSI